MVAIVLVITWIFALITVNKLNLRFFKFLIGSIGLFFLIMYIFRQALEQNLEYEVTVLVGIVGKVTHLYIAYPDYSMISVYFGKEVISFFVDYECSGFIEMLVYVCLLIFYPVYGIYDKIRLSIIGVIFIITSNTLRVLLICSVVKVFGSNVFFLTHTVIARIFFFTLMVALYYRVFTKPHILRQRVGNLYAK